VSIEYLAERLVEDFGEPVAGADDLLLAEGDLGSRALGDGFYVGVEAGGGAGRYFCHL
jgi:hypothetical protein